MATEASVKSQIQYITKLYEDTRKAAGVNASANWIDTEETLLGLLSGDYSDDAFQGVRAGRGILATLMEQVRAPLGSKLLDYAKVLNYPETDIQTVMSRLYDDAIANTKRVQSRQFVFGTVTSGSPYVGNGTIHRLNVDENGLVIENRVAETKTFECVFDATSGARGRNAEVFQIRGVTANRDLIRINGSGGVGALVGLTADLSAAYIRNPSFSQFSGTVTVPTDITGWTNNTTVSAATHQLVTDTYANQGVGYYRDFPGDSTSYALQCLGNSWSLTQSIEQNRYAFRLDAPYYVQIAYKKSSSGTDGNLVVTLGANSVTLDLSTISDTSWHVLKFTLNKNLWFKNFNQANLSFTIARTGGSTGNVTIDDVLVAPFTNFDGGWWAAVGGTTQWKRLDTATVTDSELGEGYGVLQKWFWRAFGRYYPAAPKSPSGTIAVALAGAGAGNVENGAHGYAFTYVDANGIESGTSGTASVTVTDKTTNGKVSVSSVAVGPTGTASRKVYRTVAAGSTYKLLTTIADNVTTTYTDNTADASLGATIPDGVTWSDPS